MSLMRNFCGGPAASEVAQPMPGLPPEAQCMTVYEHVGPQGMPQTMPGADEDPAVDEKALQQARTRRMCIGIGCALLILLIVVLVICFAVVPSQIRRTMHQGTFVVEDFSLSYISPDAVSVSLQLTIPRHPYGMTTVSGFTAQIFTDQNEHLFDLDVGSFSGSTLQVSNQIVALASQPSFVSTISKLLNEDVTLFFVGKTRFRVVAIPVTVALNNALSLRASTYKGAVTATSATLSQATVIFSITTDTQVSLDFGVTESVITFGYGGAEIATLSGELAIHPGSNTLYLDAKSTDTSKTPRCLVESRATAAITNLILQGRSDGLGDWKDGVVQAMSQQIVLSQRQLQLMS